MTTSRSAGAAGGPAGWALAVAVWLAAATVAHAAPLAATPQPGAENSSTQSEPYRAGIAALAKGSFDEAAAAFEAAAKADPKSPDPLLALAEVASRRGRLNDAGTWLGKALAVAPEHAAANAAMGRYLLITGKAQDGQARLRKAIQLDARAVRPRVDLADHLSANRRWADAVPLYEACIALEPQNAGVHYALGLAYANVGQADKAKASLDTAARLDPKNPLPHVALARWQAGRKDFAQAQSEVDEALKRAPKLLEALLLRGDLLDAKGDAAGALRAYDDASKVHPKAPAPLMRAAMVHQRSGQDAEALPLYVKVTDLDPKNALALNNIADIHSRRKDGLKDAERYASKAVALAPKWADAHDTLGWIQRALGDLPAARASLETATRLAPGNGESLYRLAQTYADQGDRAKAKATLQAALKAATPVVSTAPARKLQDELGA